jgi:arylsulfatase A-like enzyme
MLGRYYEEFAIDARRGLSNFTGLLLAEALEWVGRGGPQPHFLYWAPDSTHGPWYAAPGFRGSSSRASAYGDAVVELDTAVGRILEAVRRDPGERDTIVIFTSDNGADLNAREKGGRSAGWAGSQ